MQQRANLERLAEGIFARRGYRGATIREVAAQACCSVGQIYKLYPNKLELYRAITDAKAELLNSTVRQTLSSNDRPDERLRRLVYILLGFFQEHVVFFRILALETGPQLVCGNPQFLERVEQWKTEFVTRIAEVIREGQRGGIFRSKLDADLAAVSFLGLLHGHTDGWVLHKEDGMLVDRADAILDLFFAGARQGRKQ